MTETQVRRGREGSRWFNERPDAQAVADWFKEVPLHDGMEADRYIGGIVLIEQKVKLDEVTGFQQDGRPIIATRRKDADNRVEHLTYTPYPKVETRVQYFWDLMAANEDWLGIIEPVGGDPAIGPGFTSRRFVGSKNGKPIQSAFVVCQMRCVVYDRASYSESWHRPSGRQEGEPKLLRSGKTIIAGAPASKMVATANNWGDIDQFSMMKAETGAVGRALGMAGMLVIPGAGVATAEDMNEAAALEGRAPAPTPEVAALPQDAAEPSEETEEALRARASGLIADLKGESAEAAEELKEWAKGRDIDWEKADKLALKGIVKKVEKELDRVRSAAAEEATAAAQGS